METEALNTTHTTSTTPSFTNQSLNENVKQIMQTYFDRLGGNQLPVDVYDKFLFEVERPLLELVMQKTHHNQSKAAVWLGLARGTLRKKLKRYGMIAESDQDTDDATT